jgi:hypothetical protein
MIMLATYEVGFSDVASKVTGVFTIYSFSRVTSNSGDIYSNESGQPVQWAMAFFALTIATNLLSSGKHISVSALQRP